MLLNCLSTKSAVNGIKIGIGTGIGRMQRLSSIFDGFSILAGIFLISSSVFENNEFDVFNDLKKLIEETESTYFSFEYEFGRSKFCVT